MDDRFQVAKDEWTIELANEWAKNFPPEPVMASGEDYGLFVQRQTFYAQYRNDVSTRREELRAKVKRLSLPKAPVGDDIAAGIEWIVVTGETPLEMLVKGYRNGSWEPKDRISCAKSVLEYVHRKLPAHFDTASITEADLGKMAETIKQVEKVLAERMRAQKSVKEPVKE